MASKISKIPDSYVASNRARYASLGWGKREGKGERRGGSPSPSVYVGRGGYRWWVSPRHKTPHPL